MDKQITQILGEIIKRYGAETLDDPKRFAGILQDYCKGEYKRERRGLLDALEDRVPNNLLLPAHNLGIELLVDQQTRRLLDSRMMSEDAARDIVETWALALGVLSAPLSRPQVIIQPSRTETPVITPSPLQTGNNLNIVLAPGVEMAFVRVPAGEFLMGSDKKIVSSASDDELPQHKVYLDEYLIGKYPVTVAQFAVFTKASGYITMAEKIGNGPDWQHPKGSGSDIRQKLAHPVTAVSWEDAAEFCGWMSEASGKKIRLPSEAEWEKAARGTDGRTYPWGWGNQPPDASYCNFNDNVKDTTPVGRYSPKGDSPYGCADMAGNVWEWVNDWYDAKYYQNSPQKNPRGSVSGEYRVFRGGSWVSETRVVRASLRYWIQSRLQELMGLNINGFRCAR